MALHLRQGTPAPLFDRLVAHEILGVHRYRQSFGKFGELRDSIVEQLGWLLNTRSPADLPTLEARLLAGTRSTIDYGLPDLSAFPLGEASTIAQLNHHVLQTIIFYEPRLRDPRVIIATAASRSNVLGAAISGVIEFGRSLVPIAFTVPIGADRSDADVR